MRTIFTQSTTSLCAENVKFADETYHYKNVSLLFVSMSCWVNCGCSRIVVFNVMTKVAAATLTFGLPGILWKIYFFLLEISYIFLSVFSSTIVFNLFFSPGLPLPFTSPVLCQLTWAVTQNKMRNWSAAHQLHKLTGGWLCACLCMCMSVHRFLTVEKK